MNLSETKRKEMSSGNEFDATDKKGRCRDNN